MAAWPRVLRHLPAWLLWGLFAGSLAVAVASAINNHRALWIRKTFVLEAGKISPAGKSGYRASLPKKCDAAVLTEQGAVLGPRTYAKSDVEAERGGIFFVKGRELLFSTSDDSDPRRNNRRYELAYAAPWMRGLEMASLLVALLAGTLLILRRLEGCVWWRPVIRKPPGGSGVLDWMGRNTWIILMLPSLLFLLDCPPLWRDSDAYWQLHSKPGTNTILHWPPLYCFGARLPMFAGAWLDTLAHGGKIRFSDFIESVDFSDWGIYGLVIAQHALLVAALWWLVGRISKAPGVRVGVALFFASIPGWYAFAHCVGSEALSNVVTLFFLGAALLFFRSARPGWRLFLLVVLGLALCILTRHVNAVMAAVLPLATGLQWLTSLAERRGAGANMALARKCLISIVACVAAICAGTLVLKILCLTQHMEYRSRIGYTFQWRLNYLIPMDKAAREKLLLELSGKSDDPLVRKAILAIPGGISPDRQWDTGYFNDFLLNELQLAGVKTKEARDAAKDRRLNAIAGIFLASNDPFLRQTIFKDFLKGLGWSPSDVAWDPVSTTRWLNERIGLEQFAEIRALSTFRNAGATFQAPRLVGAYIDLWKWCPLGVCGAAFRWRHFLHDPANESPGDLAARRGHHAHRMPALPAELQPDFLRAAICAAHDDPARRGRGAHRGGVRREGGAGGK
jgi:hypothetical protein